MGYASSELLELIKAENQQTREAYKKVTEETIRELKLLNEKLDNLNKQLEHISLQAKTTDKDNTSKNPKHADENREPNEDRLVSLKHLSEKYPFTQKNLVNLARKNKFPKVRVGKEYKVWLSKFDHWYKTSGIYYADSDNSGLRDEK
jgi:hypothetical protein